MATLDIPEIKEELVVFLRNSDILTIADRGVATVTEEFDGDNSTVDFVVTGANPLRNVRTVTIGGTAQSLGTDYSVDYSTKTVTFTSAPASGTDNVDITYDHGSTDKIYPDYPRNDLSLNNYPRIAVDFISGTTNPAGFGNVHRTDFLFTVVVYAESQNVITSALKSVRSAFINARTDFNTLNVINPVSIGPLIGSADRSDKILQQNVDFEGQFNYEKN